MALKNGKRKAQTGIELGDQTLLISRLHLDPLNPRHDPLESDAEVIAQLCNHELVAELAQDIAIRGSLSPLDVLGVIPFEGNPGHFIALEGNRRTCALIILSDPSRAPTNTLQTQLRRIAAKASIPKEVKVHVFANRQAAKPWIELRHLGPQGGIGTREWNPSQKTRAAGGNSKTSSQANTLALAVLDRLVQLGMLTTDQRSKVSLTTITRYLSNPGLRATLGLSSGKELKYAYDINEVDSALCQLVLDSINAQPDGSYAVHSRSKSQDCFNYALELKAQGKAPSTPLPSPTVPSPPSTSSASSNASKKRSAKSPNSLTTLFDRSFTVACKDPALLRLRDEALKLELDDFPFSGNYVLRAFVEQVMVLFAKKRGKWNSNLSDEQLTHACVGELQALGIKGKALVNISKAAGSAAQPHSLHSLGHAAHGGSIPTRQHLRAMFDTWEPSLRAMLDAL